MKSISIIIILLFAVSIIVSLGVRPLAIPDETRYVKIAREILQSGNWVVTHLAQKWQFKKRYSDTGSLLPL